MMGPCVPTFFTPPLDLMIVSLQENNVGLGKVAMAFPSTIRRPGSAANIEESRA